MTDFDRNLIHQISLRFFNKSLPHIADIHNLCGTTFYGGDRIRPKFGRTHKSQSKIQQLMSHLISRDQRVAVFNFGTDRVRVLEKTSGSGSGTVRVRVLALHF